MNYCRLYGRLFRDWIGYIRVLRRNSIEFGVPICRVGDSIRMGGRAVLGFGMSKVLECDSGVREATVHSHIVSGKSSLQDHISAILNGVPRQCILYERDGAEYIKCYSYEKYPRTELLKDVEDMRNTDRDEHDRKMEYYDRKYLLCEEPIEVE